MKKKTLQDQVQDEKHDRETKIAESKEKGQIQAKELQIQHEETMTTLKKQQKKMKAELDKIVTANAKVEKELEKMNGNRFNNLDTMMTQHDTEIRGAETTMTRAQADYDEVSADLGQSKDEFSLLKQEQGKREEIQKMLEAKNKEFTDKMDRLNRASQFIQAHWNGMQARKERDKAMKGKRKKKKKK